VRGVQAEVEADVDDQPLGLETVLAKAQTECLSLRKISLLGQVVEDVWVDSPAHVNQVERSDLDHVIVYHQCVGWRL